MIDRRALLKSGGIGLLTLGTGPSFLARAVAATADRPTGTSRRRTLVAIFLRGAMDGLAAVQPLGDRRLRRLRPRLVMTETTRRSVEEPLVDLGVDFGLHPAFSSLLPYCSDGRLAIVHGVGSPDPTRSHFDAQDYMESGTPGRKGTPDGWLNRVAGRLGHDATPFRTVAATGAMPRSLYGPQPAIAVADLGTFHLDLPGRQRTEDFASRALEALYENQAEGVLREAAGDAFEARRLLDRLESRPGRPRAGADYPRSSLGAALRQIAWLVRADVGLEIAFAESGGWDTHVQQGTVGGSFSRRARDLAQSISAFWHDLGDRSSDVVVMTMTEFGRTVRENGSGGTDHGHGSCLFVLGDDVRGGRVHGHLPELREDELHEGRDLPVTTDFRAVFSGVAGAHLRIARSTELFPGWSGTPLALLRD